jgi:hypothetical protein
LQSNSTNMDMTWQLYRLYHLSIEHHMLYSVISVCCVCFAITEAKAKNKSFPAPILHPYHLHISTGWHSLTLLHSIYPSHLNLPQLTNSAALGIKNTRKTDSVTTRGRAHII